MESFSGCKVTITIVSANKLKNINGSGKGDLSPFVEFRYHNKTYKTKAIQNTFNPAWNEIFQLELVDNDNNDIIFKVIDKVLILSDNLLGIVRIPISILRERVPICEWFDIEPPPLNMINAHSNNNNSNNSNNNSPTFKPQAVKEQLQQQQLGQLKQLGQLNLMFTYNEFQKNRKKNEVSDDWFILDNIDNNSNSTTTTTTTSPNNNNFKNKNIGDVHIHLPAQSTQSSPPSYELFPPLQQKYQQQQKQQQYIQPLQFPQYNNTTQQSSPPSYEQFPPLQQKYQQSTGDFLPNYNQQHHLYQPNQSPPMLHNPQPQQQINNMNFTNNNGSKNSNYNSNGNSNNNSMTNSPKMVQNLSNSYLNNMIMNFGDSIDLETIELLKATLKEESIYSGKDDMNMLSHCILCNCKATNDNSLYLMEECLHNFCKNCLEKGISQQMKLPTISADINCLANGCMEKIEQEILRFILGNQEYENYLNKTLEAALQSNPDIITCPNSKCGFIFERCSGSTGGMNDSSISKPSFDGKKMSEESAKHRMEHRFRCGKCSLEFCSSCYTSPYHDYYTCEKYKEYLNSKKCRFCSSRITSTTPILSSVQNNSNNNKNNNQDQDVCNLEECQTKLSMACNKIHSSCNHRCIGVLDEEKCLPCMNEKCYQTNKFLQDDNELCNICWVESLNSAPTIQLECSHIFHYACIQKQINKKQGPRITFNNIECVICKKILSHPSIKTEMDQILDFKKVIQAKANERYTFENLQKSKELEDKKSKYYQNPDLFALDRYVYYKCFKCQLPYFAGAARCDEGLNGYKEEELLCNSCLGVDKNGECKIHGVDYITWKCKFCCSEASYFCWNKTHFCGDCHTKQQKGEYLNKKPIEEIPKCPGPDKCPLKISHPHVEEVILGCSLCKNFNNF